MHLSRKRRAIQSYVVSRIRDDNHVPIAEVLAPYPNVTILDEIDSGTALVRMPINVRRRISAEHPELFIELNLAYKAQTY